jgi:hypothetical protein
VTRGDWLIFAGGVVAGVLAILAVGWAFYVVGRSEDRERAAADRAASTERHGRAGQREDDSEGRPDRPALDDPRIRRRRGSND